MSADALKVATLLAAALDDEDYVAVAALLADDCVYLTPSGASGAA